MKQNKFTTKCPSCKGELEYEKTYRNHYRQNFRCELYRCRECNHPVEKQIDEPIEKIFPVIKDISVTVEEKSSRQPRIFKKGSISSVLYCCTNSKYYDRGIYLESVVSEMIRGKKTRQKIREFCKGVEHTPTGRIRAQCDQYFIITIDLTFEEK